MLIAPLDWGLGHATRCIPLIEKLLFAGFKVIIAAGGDQKILLQSAFPGLEFVDLKGYNLKYGSTKFLTILKIIFQVPKILTKINSENKWLRGIIASKHLDMVISDNRFGLHNHSIVSIFITHQLRIQSSLGRWMDMIIQRLNYYFINQFNYCWVPDAAGEINLAGELSHPAIKPNTNVFYMGVLSAIKKENVAETNKLLILLSGPEPQRTILENILLAQLIQYAMPAILVRGLPAAAEIISPYEGLTIYNYLTGLPLQKAINESGVIVSRSGYSTIMDVLPLGKKCILIPTPGQAEQEYLAKWMAQQQYACVSLQHNFSLPFMIEQTNKLQITDLSFLKDAKKTDEAIAIIMAALHTRQ